MSSVVQRWGKVVVLGRGGGVGEGGYALHGYEACGSHVSSLPGGHVDLVAV